MPPGGDGFYYFSTYLIVFFEEYGYFDIEINGELMCTAYTNQGSSSNGLASCNVFAFATEGKSSSRRIEVKIFTQLGSCNLMPYNNFNFILCSYGMSAFISM